MRTEINRTQVSQQYFEIRNELNRSNRIENMKTELEFEIRENEVEWFIIIKSTGAKHGIRLATYKKIRNRWVLFHNEKYNEFYKYLFLKIKLLSADDYKKINSLLTSWLQRLWMS